MVANIGKRLAGRQKRRCVAVETHPCCNRSIGEQLSSFWGLCLGPLGRLRIASRQGRTVRRLDTDPVPRRHRRHSADKKKRGLSVRLRNNCWLAGWLAGCHSTSSSRSTGVYVKVVKVVGRTALEGWTHHIGHAKEAFHCFSMWWLPCSNHIGSRLGVLIWYPSTVFGTEAGAASFPSSQNARMDVWPVRELHVFLFPSMLNSATPPGTATFFRQERGALFSVWQFLVLAPGCIWQSYSNRRAGTAVRLRSLGQNKHSLATLHYHWRAKQAAQQSFGYWP